jgi:hypothetical protein
MRRCKPPLQTAAADTVTNIARSHHKDDDLEY